MLFGKMQNSAKQVRPEIQGHGVVTELVRALFWLRTRATGIPARAFAIVYLFCKFASDSIPSAGCTGGTSGERTHTLMISLARPFSSLPRRCEGRYISAVVYQRDCTPLVASSGLEVRKCVATVVGCNLLASYKTPKADASIAPLDERTESGRLSFPAGQWYHQESNLDPADILAHGRTSRWSTPYCQQSPRAENWNKLRRLANLVHSHVAG